MAKAKGNNSKREYQFTALAQTEAKECATALSEVVRGSLRVKRVRGDVDKASGP